VCTGALPKEIFAPLAELHALIGRRLEGALTGWGGVEDISGRRRGYGYFSQAHYSRQHTMREYVGEAAESDRVANRRASVLLAEEELPPNTHAALQSLTELLSPLLPARYRDVVKPEMLVAAQPNLHNGRRYLRPHLDEPLHDGFGVVIVTIGIRGRSSILLRSRPWETDALERWFPLSSGEAYALSGDARNVCLHGVLADNESEHRESLNLRFGLHATERNGRFSAWDEIEKHWPSAEAVPAPCERAEPAPES